MPPYDNTSGSGAGSEDGVPPAGGHVTIRRMDELAEAKAYLDRIGARATGPWSAAIHTECDGYEFDWSSVKLEYEVHGRTASITEVKFWGEDPDLAPTKDERKAILEAAKRVLWPRPFLRYGLGHDLPDDMAEALRTGNIYIFHDAERDPRNCYVQTYHPGVAGRGKYRSWVHIDTQEWISGQPNDLPLYGLDQIGKMAEAAEGRPERVVIHEGPKAAEMVKRYLDPSREDNRLDHPWAEFLSTSIHLGWPGGGNRYRKVDWSPLQHAKLKNLPVVVVSDHDGVGIEAAAAIAEEYVPGSIDRDVRWLKWPDGLGLKRGFDLADPWPVGSVPPLEGMLKRRRYVGDAKATVLGPLTLEVSKRLGEHSSVFSHAQQATVIVRQASAILKDPNDPDRNRPAMRVRTVAADPEMLRPYVEEVSVWRKYDERRREGDRLVPAMVPDKLLQQLVRQQHHLAPLAGAVDFPIISKGRLLAGNIGYDPDSLLFINSPKIEVEEWSDPEAALHFLEHDWMGRFPFATRNDRLRMLTLPPTLMLRPADIRGGAPFYFFVSGSAQIGKSWAARCLCAAVLGSPPPVAPWPEQPEELKKQLLAAALESPPVIFYDNVTNRWQVGGGPLDGYGTSDEYQDRILGESRTATATALSLLIFSGNNITPKQDTTTRSVTGRLRMPEQKHPDMDRAMDFTMANRGRILGAYLSILRVPPAPLPDGLRFADWGRLVAGPMMAVAGEPDMIRDMAEAHKVAAHGATNLGPVLLAIHRLQGEGWLTVTDMLKDELCNAALHELFPKKDGSSKPWTAAGLGPKLTGYEDNSADGLTLRMEERKRPNGNPLKVYRVTGEPNEEEELQVL